MGKNPPGSRYCRRSLEVKIKNTGRSLPFIIDVLYNKSNAFYANLIRNDVLIEINGQPIFTADDYYSYMRNYSGVSFKLKLIRNGREIEITY